MTTKRRTMKLMVLLPEEVLVDTEAVKIVAEAANGSFCMLPRHVDFVAALVPGLLSFTTPGGEEEFLAVDEGVLVKCDAVVRVSVKNAVRGADLGELRKTVEEKFRALDDRERKARSAVAKLDAALVRRFIELGERFHE